MKHKGPLYLIPYNDARRRAYISLLRIVIADQRTLLFNCISLLLLHYKMITGKLTDDDKDDLVPPISPIQLLL